MKPPHRAGLSLFLSGKTINPSAFVQNLVFISEILLLTERSACMTVVRAEANQLDLLHRRDDDDNMPGMRGTEAERNRAHIAHGTVISIAIVLLFPIGGMITRQSHFKHRIWLHAAWQMFSMLVLITGFALGVWLSILHNEVSFASPPNEPY